eukprot:UN09421
MAQAINPECFMVDNDTGYKMHKLQFISLETVNLDPLTVIDHEQQTRKAKQKEMHLKFVVVMATILIIISLVMAIHFDKYATKTKDDSTLYFCGWDGVKTSTYFGHSFGSIWLNLVEESLLSDDKPLNAIGILFMLFSLILLCIGCFCQCCDQQFAWCLLLVFKCKCQWGPAIIYGLSFITSMLFIIFWYSSSDCSLSDGYGIGISMAFMFGGSALSLFGYINTN